MPALGSEIVANALVVQRLMPHAMLVGGIYTMGYDECLVLTNDLWKKQAGGIPQHCFLLATAMIPGKAPDVDDEEVILLRVIGPSTLPAEGELVQVRAEAMRQMVIDRGADGASQSSAILDVLTRNEIQFSAIRAKILGTFYDGEVNGTSLLNFGSDVETFHSASHYKVYKPYGDSLAIIASFPEVTESELLQRQQGQPLPTRLQIGRVRYSSTIRRSRRAQQDANINVPVKVNVADFVALKTAIFGMTRLGKSNTMKTIATAVCQYAVETNQRIGQLLFDPAGEYANPNQQDQTALAQIGDEFVVRYRLGSDGQDGFRPLATNFFSDGTISITWSIIRNILAGHTAQYVKDFLTVDLLGPDNPQTDEERSSANRAARRRYAFYAALMEAGFTCLPGRRFALEANEPVRNAVSQQLTQMGLDDVQPSRRNPISPIQLQNWFRALLPIRKTQAFKTATRSSSGEDWVDAQLEHVLTLLEGNIGSGARVLNNARLFHSTARDSDYSQEIYNELANGRIVIIDLSRGNETVQQFCSEQIVNYILAQASERFISGQPALNMQIFVEEAHRLFNREKMEDISSVDPYVRLAKEAAKYKIGLIYATQEVSSVDPIILSNTSNWIVTHLNNKMEIKELSKYYDFEDFGELTLKAEDVGFVRMKTKSGRYIIPTQINLFDRQQVDGARQACLRAREKAQGKH